MAESDMRNEVLYMQRRWYVVTLGTVFETEWCVQHRVEELPETSGAEQASTWEIYPQAFPGVIASHFGGRHVQPEAILTLTIVSAGKNSGYLCQHRKHGRRNAHRCHYHGSNSQLRRGPVGACGRRDKHCNNWQEQLELPLDPHRDERRSSPQPADCCWSCSQSRPLTTTRSYSEWSPKRHLNIILICFFGDGWFI